ncbi:MAG: diaminopimelate epimerase [Fimbriimonadaceae bacterium]|nr:diaminopimelate epimerase [Fimbriimonadaceae bacterium]
MIEFVKMHGLGNDFVMVDAFARSFDDAELPDLARRLNNRRFGIGGDGLILALPGERAALRMRMFNPDGSESEMCGNGVRCFARFVREAGRTDADEIEVETGAGVLRLESLSDGQVRVDMGRARLTRGEIGMTCGCHSERSEESRSQAERNEEPRFHPSDDPAEEFLDRPVAVGDAILAGTATSMGNPHLTLFVDDVASVPLESWGPVLEGHPEFPARVNVHFVQVMDRGHLRQRTWERGAGATLACGTGACASAVAAFRTGRADRDVIVTLPGGDLRIEYGEDGTVFMTGPAERVFSGRWLGD